MKALKIFAFAAVAAVMAVSCGRSEVKVDVELPTTAEIDSVSYLLGVNYGIMFIGFALAGIVGPKVLLAFPAPYTGAFITAMGIGAVGIVFSVIYRVMSKAK